MKNIRNGGLVGLLAGIAVNQTVNLLMSYMLSLGYYAPCFAALDERFGGELNAAAMQMLCAALLGMGIGAGIGWAGHKKKEHHT